MSKPTIILNNNIVGKNPVIRLDFDFDQTINYKVKSINGTRWTQSSRFWYIPKYEFSQEIINKSQLKPKLYFFRISRKNNSLTEKVSIK